MGKYPANLTEKENSKLKHPFLPLDQYDEVYKSPTGATILILHSKNKITKAEIARMVEINRQTYMRELMA